MIKFFRKIRQKLLAENKFSKYLIYAIGEIVLVVIGILIALQINNWNEQRKADIAENKALIALKNEFENNIERLKSLCEDKARFEESHRTYWNIITNDTIPVKTKAKAFPSGGVGKTWGVQNTVLNGLVSSGQIDNIKNDSLKKLLTLWPNLVQTWNYEEEKWISINHENDNYLKTRTRDIPPYTSEGKFWQFNKENYVEEWQAQRALFVNDLEHQNLIARKTRQLYIQSIIFEKIMADYQKIISALNIELNNRKIE
jgi:hypothetical protein